MTVAAAIALLLWLVLLLVPWQPWRCREQLEPATEGGEPDYDFTVLIPARNEAGVIAETLAAIARAAPAAPVVVVDDESEDDTATVARASGLENLRIVAGTPPPPGWAGKLWALEQGLGYVETPNVLLLDADIRLAPDMIAALQGKAREEGLALVSVLAEPCWSGLAARLLLPAFVYFFKLLYPFALANRRRGPVAAAAGGVMLVKREALRSAGGFAAWRGAIIDDCTLARALKRAGYPVWLGLSRSAASLRRQSPASIAGMVTRSAWVQLHESPLLLLAATALMVLAFWLPPAALAFNGPPRWLGLAACLALAASYLPTLVYYRRNPAAAILLPVIATAYLAMTWYSALRALAGIRSAWKGRRYRTAEARREK